MNVRNILLGIGAVLLVMLALVRLSMIPSHHRDNRMQVVATIYPLAEFARQVGGDTVHVTTLVKPGIEPHDYEPTTQDLANIYSAKMFVYNGAGLEPWVKKIQPDLSRSDVFVDEATFEMSLLSRDPSDTESTAATDPHVWMSPERAIKQVTNIMNGYIGIDPANVARYQANTDAYIRQLTALDEEFKAGLSQCETRTIITSHQAFNYLAHDYNLQAVGIAGLSPDDEPSPQKLAQIADLARQNNVHYIFFESLVSPKLSQTIANEVGAQIIAFNPLEGLTPQEAKAGKNYISIQKDNLQALRTALHCT